MVAFALRCGANGGRVGSGFWLGDGKGLQPQISPGYLRQVLPFLFFGSMPEERAHGVHLGVGRTRISAAAVDLSEDHTPRRETETHTAVLLRYKGTGIAGTRHRGDELLGVVAF